MLQRKLSRKERRKVSQLEREKEREAARVTGTRVLHHDPYRYNCYLLYTEGFSTMCLGKFFCDLLIAFAYTENQGEVPLMMLILGLEGIWPIFGDSRMDVPR